MKITDRKPGSCRVSVSVELPEGGFTVNRVHIRDDGGKPRITLPLSQRLHPYVTLRGELKRAVYGAIEGAYAAGRDRAEAGPVPEADL